MGRTDYGVSPEDFCRAWQTSNGGGEYANPAEVAEKLGMPKPIVLARASNYRQMGIPLKPAKRGAPKGLDVEALKELIQNIDQERGEGTPAADRRLAGRRGRPPDR
jgi:hypothetical protein